MFLNVLYTCTCFNHKKKEIEIPIVNECFFSY